MNTRMPQKFALENRQLVLMEMGLKMPSGRFDDESFRSRRILGQFEDMGATLGRTLDRIMSHPLGCRLRWGVGVCHMLLGIKGQNGPYARSYLSCRMSRTLG